MKEMLGGCSVCCDDTGWAENPLVYCDGPNCNVAVHQACYGIRSVPKDEWFCRKCESFQEKNIKVKCELCPSKDGALKPTECGQWAHVVCALYIPEVTFLDVTTMEPIKLSAIPRDRFNRACYICDEKNKVSKSASYGACMPCNKTGCKLGMHVTCAQSIGLLCEEAGNYLDNVKYVGYCKHHYSKLKKSNNIKPIAPYRPQNNTENSSNECTPEKLTVSNPDTESLASKQKKKLTVSGDKVVNEKKGKDHKEINLSSTQSNEKKNSQPHIVSPSPIGSLIISVGTKTENMTTGIKNQHPYDSESGKPTKILKTENLMHAESSNSYKNQNIGAKIIEESNISKSETKTIVIKSNIPGVNLIKLPEQNVWKQETSVISAKKTHTASKKETMEKKVIETNSNAVHMLGNSLNSSSSMALNMVDTLNEEIETHKKFSGERNGPSSQPQQSVMGPQLPRRHPKPPPISQSEISQSQGSVPTTWSSLTNGLNNNSTYGLEDLLERHWEQGGAFLMEQAQHFDIASLLTCLYQLKNENINLEEELASYTKRRDHLLAVNARLALPLQPPPAQNAGNRTPTTTSTSLMNNHSETIVLSRPNYQSSLQSLDTQLQHRYQNHSMPNRHQVHHNVPNSIPSQVVIRGNIQDPRSDVRRQTNQNSSQINFNQMYSSNIQQIPNVGLPRHQLGIDGHPKHS
ncbi:zinc finger protein zfp-1-like [Daktulosphaira vitifoliae]|uniref:zinc finger protein zfp-1-like n=1 Tax=Daktulosphaira vitifoliae TaxID=58002 RepID=UPI0021AA8833|nr:zinc finger protein zfp-1-like [Daktulosphaira vitifoliae]